MPAGGGALAVYAVGFFVAEAAFMKATAMEMQRMEREEELQRVASIAAAEVVRIMSNVQAQAPVVTTVAAVAAETMRKDVESIKADVGEIKTKLENHYVSVEQFEPVRRIVYGVVGMFGLALVGAIVTLVLKR